jgi:hypothetical protein
MLAVLGHLKKCPPSGCTPFYLDNFVSHAESHTVCSVQILTVYHPAYFLLMASIANTLKGVSMMAGGSTRAAFNISFAQGENIADITAKATSQYICTSLMGTCIGILISSQISNNVGAALITSCGIGAVAALLTYKTIRSVPLANLNSTRLQLLIDQYELLREGGAGAVPSPVPLPRPSALCASDPVVVLPFYMSQVRLRCLCPRVVQVHTFRYVMLALCSLCLEFRLTCHVLQCYCSNACNSCAAMCSIVRSTRQ